MSFYKKVFVCLTLLSFVFLPSFVFAQGIQDAFGGEGSGSPLETVRSKTGFSATDSIGTISGRAINVALSMVGLIFLVLMVYSGFLWMTARGEEAQVEKAQKIIKGTIIGLVLVLSAYAITFLITNALNK